MICIYDKKTTKGNFQINGLGVLDGEDITFTPKQKLLKGDNVVGIPIGIPQVKCGAHYLGIFLCVDTGSMKIPKNVWLMEEIFYEIGEISHRSENPRQEFKL